MWRICPSKQAVLSAPHGVRLHYGAMDGTSEGRGGEGRGGEGRGGEGRGEQ